MGKGKKEALKLKEKSPHSWTVNCSVTARNMRKGDLGGVIFGCKHSTIKECLLKQIFGLPAPHYAYVRNIDSGLPLFLFNYSDRRLHGIFEAVSKGQMNINRHGWTSDGTDTPYAAQVRVKSRMQCQSLQEDQFRPVIEDNYYEPQHFWFELDREQTEKLISLFSCSPVTARTNFSNSSGKWSTLVTMPYVPNSWEEDRSKKLKGQLTETSKNNGVNNDHHTVVGLKPACGLSYSSVVRNMSTPDVHSVLSDMERSSLDVAPGLGSEIMQLEATISKNAVENYKVAHGHASHVRTYSSIVCSDQTNTGWSSCDDHPGLDSERQLLEATVSEKETENCDLVHKQVDHEKDYSSVGHSDESKMRRNSWDDLASWVKESQLLEVTTMDAVESHEEVPHEQGEHDVHTYSSSVENLGNVLLQKNWTSLFKTESTSTAISEVEKFETSESDINIIHSDQSNMKGKSSHVAHCLDGENQLSESHTVQENARKHDESRGFQIQTAIAVVNSSDIDKTDIDWTSSCSAPHLSGHKQPSEAPSGDSENPTDICACEHGIHHHGCVDLKPAGESTADSEIMSVDNLREYTEMQPADICFPEAVMGSDMNLPDLQTIAAKLIEEVKDLKSTQLKQAQKISLLEQELVYSRLEIQKLKNCCKPFGSSSELDDSIVIVGGCDGPSWLSALDIYSPSSDSIISLCHMSSVRKYKAAAKLNGQLYILGGVCGDIWYDTVESFNVVTNQWTCCPSMNRGKGSLVGITLNNKIFAIGGGDGKQSLSEVEMFYPEIGRWLPTKSMLHKRFAPAAAEINGILYVAGGYDGKDYLKSFERFDSRECSWTRLEDMTSKRGCHSLAVLNGKLYALGGYNGSAMDGTVEIYDPRMASWVIGEPMKESRGYFGAAVTRDAIYVVGGLSKNDEIVDMVETYKEGQGWQVTSLKGIGKRAFFCTVA